MFKILSSRLLWGLVLIIGGGLLLLDTFGIFKGGALFWTVLSAVAGVLFLIAYFTNRVQWWALFPGVIFLAIAAMIGLTSFVPGFPARLSGAIFLGGIGLSFLLVYLVERRNWWAIIPMGIMATLAVIAGLESYTSSTASGGILFLGFGFTFGLVAVLPNSVGRMRWAWIPAVILAVFGFLIVLAAEAYLNLIWPAALILAGILLVIRAIVRKQS